MRLNKILILSLLFSSFLFSETIKICENGTLSCVFVNLEQENNSLPKILKYKPLDLKYRLNSKYKKAVKIEKPTDESSDILDDYSFNFDYGLDEETNRLNKLKFDFGTKFKGIE